MSFGYTDPTNPLVRLLRAELDQLVPLMRCVEFQQRVVDYTGEWATQHKLELDPDARPSRDDVLKAIWTFTVEAVRATKSKSCRLLVRLQSGDEHIVFPLPLAGIRASRKEWLGGENPDPAMAELLDSTARHVQEAFGGLSGFLGFGRQLAAKGQATARKAARKAIKAAKGDHSGKKK